jgi:hypothetical protein
MSFPLYDIVKEKKYQKEIKNKDIDNFIKFIEDIEDQTIIEYIYIIIKKYSLEQINNLNEIYQIPYSGVISKERKDIIFDFNKFPSELQKILYGFYLMNKKK